jgi:catechol 2,3-dioxygenase-like lactoylglutathione lyase family enzyme
MEKIICGIQQMGVGVPDVQEIWKWYRTFFGANVRIFEEEAEAPLMTRYTGGEVHRRTATLALSMDGGGGFEIWQFKSRPTNKANFDIQLGDYGLYACRIKSRDVKATYAYMKDHGANVLGAPQTAPDGSWNFFVQDPNGNLFNVVEGYGWFSNTKHPAKTGAVAGALIGVSDIDKALPLYQGILGYETLVYDYTGVSDCFTALPGGQGKFRRVLLKHKDERLGPFSRLLGPTQIELIQSIDRTDCRKIFENR